MAQLTNGTDLIQQTAVSTPHDEILRRGRHLELALDPVGRRSRGRHFTAPAVAALMARYALPRAGARVLDPACGGGALLAAARARAAATLVGVDADGEAIDHCRGAFGDPVRLVEQDFLALEPADLGAPFDALLANPPYLRQERIPPERKAALKDRFRDHLTVPGAGRLDLLGYFLLHLSRFLRPGGRLAFLSSAAWLTSGYGRAIRMFLAREYRVDHVVESVAEPWFSEARTRPVLVLASRGPTPSHRAAFTRLERPLDGGSIGPGRFVPTARLADGAPWGSHLRTPPVLDEFERALGAALVPMTDRVQARFGVKTGADRLFVLHRGRDGWGRPWPGRAAALRPWLHSPMELRRLEVRADDLERCVLLLRPQDAEDPVVAAHLQEPDGGRTAERPTCAARERADGSSRWFCLSPGEPPPVVWTRTVQYRHLVAANPDGVVVNNNLVCLWPRPPASLHGLLVALNSGWTFLQRYAHGRVSNEGKIKTEVGDLARLLIPDPVRLDRVRLDRLRGREIRAIDEEIDHPQRRIFEAEVLRSLGVPSDDAAQLVDALAATIHHQVALERAWERRYRAGRRRGTT